MSPSSQRNDEGYVRKIQKTEGNYYRATLPKQYIDEVVPEGEEAENVRMTRTGPYMVVRPPLQRREITTEFPISKQAIEDLGDKPGFEDRELVDRYVEKVLQSFIMGVVDEVQITFSNGEDDEDDSNDLEDEVLKAFGKQEFGRQIQVPKGQHSVMIREGPGNYKDIYVDNVANFLSQNVLTPLQSPGLNFMEEDENEDGLVSNAIREADELDKDWSFATRQSGRKFLELEADVPREMCALHVNKYLELTVDLSLRLLHALKHLEEEHSEREAWLEEVEHKLSNVLNQEDEPYDEQLKDIATKSHNLEIEQADYRDQMKLYKTRINALDKIRYGGDRGERDAEIADELLSSGQTDKADMLDLGVSLGEIGVLMERLVRFPRSITMAGFVAANISDVHNINLSSEKETGEQTP